MTHQHIVDQWAELLKMIEAARTTTDHPDAHTCMDGLQQMAEEHTALMLAQQAELASKK